MLLRIKSSHFFGILELPLGRLGLGRGAAPAGGLHGLEQLPSAAGVAVPLEQQTDPVGLQTSTFRFTQASTQRQNNPGCWALT